MGYSNYSDVSGKWAMSNNWTSLQWLHKSSISYNYPPASWTDASKNDGCLLPDPIIKYEQTNSHIPQDISGKAFIIKYKSGGKFIDWAYKLNIDDNEMGTVKNIKIMCDDMYAYIIGLYTVTGVDGVQMFEYKWDLESKPYYVNKITPFSSITSNINEYVTYKYLTKYDEGGSKPYYRFTFEHKKDIYSKDIIWINDTSYVYTVAKFRKAIPNGSELGFNLAFEHIKVIGSLFVTFFVALLGFLVAHVE